MSWVADELTNASATWKTFTAIVTARQGSTGENMKTAQGVLMLSSGVAVALMLAAAMPAAASPAGRHNANSTGSITSILKTGDIVTGVRGTADGKVVLTGSAPAGGGTQTGPFLYEGPLTAAAKGAAVSVLTPPFLGVTSATFYGPDTHSFNPKAIPSRRPRPGHDLPRPGDRIGWIMEIHRCAC